MINAEIRWEDMDEDQFSCPDGGEFKTERRGYTHNCVMVFLACSSLSEDGGEQDRRYTHK